MLYKVTFYRKLRPLCYTLIRAATADDALTAEFRLIAQALNVTFDDVKTDEMED